MSDTPKPAFALADLSRMSELMDMEEPGDYRSRVVLTPSEAEAIKAGDENVAHRAAQRHLLAWVLRLSDQIERLEREVKAMKELPHE